MKLVRSLLSGSRRGRVPRLLLGWMALVAASPAVCADAFDRTWCEVDAGTFRLVTDRPRDEAEAMVRIMHTFRPVAEQYLAGTANARNPPLAVLVFERVRDFRRAVNNAPVVGFMQPSFTENLMVVGRDPNAFSDHESLLHEYVHYLLRTRTDVNIPTWYDEGLASMLSSARIVDERMRVGELPVDVLEENIRGARLSLTEVLEVEDLWDWRPQRIRGFYDYSRVLVHRLLLGQIKDLADLRPALSAFLTGGAPSLQAAAGDAGDGLERQLDRYLQRDPPAVSHPLPPALPGDLPYRCLDASETVRQVALALLAYNPAQAADRLRQRVAEDPGDVDLWNTLSLAEQGNGDREAALAAARHAVALDPENSDATVRLAGALVMGCILQVSAECRGRWQEAVPLLRATLRRDPTHQDAIFTLGLAYLYSGRAGDALNYLRIAHGRQPWAPALNFYLGETYRLIGDVRAEGYLQRARRWSPTELWRRLAEAALEMLHAGSPQLPSTTH